MPDPAEKPVKLTPNQEKVLAALRRFKEHEGCGATVAELHNALRGSRSGDAIRSNLAKLRSMGLVWSYGSSMTNAMCWHLNPPPELATRAHPAATKS